MAKGKPTEDEFSEWMPVSEAVGRVRGIQGPIAYHSFLRRLVDGLLRSYAENCIVDNGDDQGLTIVSQTVWRALLESDNGLSGHVWKSDDMEIRVYEDGHGSTDYRFYGIRVEPTGVWKMLPAGSRPPAKVKGVAITTGPDPASPAAASAPPLASPKHAGGAPRKEFWDDLWLAMFERLWTTKWQPKSQADIEKAMLDWAAENGKELGPTSVKIPAKKLFLLTKK